MKNFWKWILGIVIVLVVLFGLGIGSHLLMRAIYPATAGVEVEGVTPRMMVRVTGSGDLEEFTSPMVIGGRGITSYGGMMHPGGGFMRLGWLVPLALIGLVIYGAYRLGIRKNQVVVTPAAPAANAAVRTCARCGQPVQEGWNNCASCGRKL
jgi:hypothetical protein